MNKNLKKIIVVGLLLSLNIGTSIKVFATPEEEYVNINNTIEESSIQEIILNIQEYDNNIEQKMDKLEKLQEELDRKNEKIKSNEEQIEALKKDVEEKDKLLGERVKALENNGGIQVTALTYIEALLNSGNLLDAIHNLDSIYRVCKNDVKLIEEAKSAKETLENTENKIKEDTRQLKEDQRYIEEELEKLEEEKDKLIKYIEEHNELLGITNGSIVPVELPNDISDIVANLINSAQSYLGVPYLWGGTTPSGFDCSGLMQYVFAKEEISIPRTSQEQQKVSKPIDIKDIEPGDLVFNKENNSTHVGMYIGNDLYIHAPHTGDVVKISKLSTSNMKYVGKVLE